MSQTAIRRWYLVHKWTSLVCTAFLLMLCVTGLPLIFHEELDRAFGHVPPLADVPSGTPRPTLDAIVAKVLSGRPGEAVQLLEFDPDRPVAIVITGSVASASEAEAHLQPVDLRTGRFIAPPPQREGFMFWMEEAHKRMFLGLGGTLFQGFMGLLFLAALVSGVVLYAPFMRKLPFGTVRRSRSRRVRWLDLHNLFGITIAAWLIAVATTGIFNTLDEPLANWWRATQLAAMTAPYKDAAPLNGIGSVDVAIEVAKRASPEMKPLIVAWPGTFFSSNHHFNVFMTGDTPLTSKLLRPSLVDASTGRLTDARDMPLLIRALFLSRPLHFGDYGGLPLKIIWALLDVAAIMVLVTGLYLWLGRRRVPIERRLAELQAGGEARPLPERTQ